jgi:hypothetical protein
MNIMTKIDKKEFANGTYNFKRWTISTNTSDKRNNGGHYNYR